MSTNEAVEAYVKGTISRRIFVRRLIAAGITMNAAVAYSELLTPDWAMADQHAGDLYGEDLYNEDLKKPLPPTSGPQSDGPPPTPQGPPEDRREPPPPPAFVTQLRVSRASLAALLVTGRLVVVVGSSLPGEVELKGVFKPRKRGKKKQKSLALGGKSVALPAPVTGKRVTLVVGRSARAVMRLRGGKLVVTSVTSSRGRTPVTKSVSLSLAGRGR